MYVLFFLCVHMNLIVLLKCLLWDNLFFLDVGLDLTLLVKM